MATFHIEAGGQSYEIEAPDEATALRAYKTHMGGEALPASQPTPAPAAEPGVRGSVTEAPTGGWTASRVLGDLGHYPAMAVRAVANGVTGLANTPMALANLAQRFIPTPDLPPTTPGGPPTKAGGDSDLLPLFPPVNFGPGFEKLAAPQNAPEAYGSALVSGTTAALLGGALSRLPAVVEATAGQIGGAAPSLLRSSVVGGGIPAAATEGVVRNVDLSGLTPDQQKLAELAIGGASAVASHTLFKGDPVGGVAAKLGDSQNADEAGRVAQAKVREWRGQLGAKLEELKGAAEGPVGEGPGVAPDGGTTGPTMFGKVPLDHATVDNTETMRTLRELAGQGGVYRDVMHAFVSDMPPRMKAMFDAIAEREGPITAYPPKAEKPYSGPLRPDTSPIVEGERSDLTPGPVPKLAKPTAGLLARPTGEASIVTTSPAPQTNPVQQRMASPDVIGGSPQVVPNEVQLPSTTLRSSSPTETVDPGMSGSRQVGPVRPGAKGPQTSPNAVTPAPGEAPWPSPEFETPKGDVVGFHAPVRDAMSLRSAVGEWIANPRLMPKGVNEAQAAALYKSLTADIGNTMEQYGAGGEWADYNARASGLYHAGNLLSKIAGDVNADKDTVQGGKAVESLWAGMRKDSSEIANLREHAPEAADEVAAAFLREKPQMWNRMPPATQRALVPNPFDRLTLSLNAAKRPDIATQLAQGKESALSGSAGYIIGDLLMPHGQAEGSTSLMSPGAWTAAGLLAPPVVRQLDKVRQNPRLLKIPAMGGVAGVSGVNAGSGAPSDDGGSPLLGSPVR